MRRSLSAEVERIDRNAIRWLIAYSRPTHVQTNAKGQEVLAVLAVLGAVGPENYNKCADQIDKL
jgi:hypothetical protein